tara:strand:- start:124 stop:444 length:321 start_codon:yes stop_codon:yes gene_type:complete
MKRVQQAINIGSYFVPGLGTYKAAKAGKWLIFSANLAGDVTLAYWVYSQFSQDPGSKQILPGSSDLRSNPPGSIEMNATTISEMSLWSSGNQEGLVKNDEGQIGVV